MHDRIDYLTDVIKVNNEELDVVKKTIYENKANPKRSTSQSSVPYFNNLLPNPVNEGNEEREKFLANNETIFMASNLRDTRFNEPLPKVPNRRISLAQAMGETSANNPLENIGVKEYVYQRAQPLRLEKKKHG